MPDTAQTVIDEEINKLRFLDRQKTAIYIIHCCTIIYTYIKEFGINLFSLILLDFGKLCVHEIQTSI